MTFSLSIYSFIYLSIHLYPSNYPSISSSIYLSIYLVQDLFYISPLYPSVYPATIEKLIILDVDLEFRYTVSENNIRAPEKRIKF